MNLLRRRSDAPSSRGQALVEFAIVLPILALLLVMALDFGRVFFGWVGLQNGARIAADFAAGNANFSAVDQTLYRNLVIEDMQAINCEPPPALDANGNGLWDPEDVPDPVFVDTDVPPNGEVTNDGDHATVLLSCRFDVITPLAGAIVGPVSLSAEAYFPINQILVPALPTPEPTPPGPCPGPTADFDVVENPAQGDPTDGVGTGSTPLIIDFTDTSIDDPLCPITKWAWDFGNLETSDIPDPSGIEFDYTGTSGFRTYIVELTVETDDALTDSVTKNVRVMKP